MTVEAAVSESTQQSKAKVFISYSRKDMAFANQLEAALKARGFEPLIDRSEIYAFEEWWKRIEALIVRADTVVFVLSPDSVASEVALKEVTFAASLNKRFAPIVCRPVENKIVPEELVRLNFIFFDDAARFEDSTNRLAEALSTDIGWIRQHTEFGDLARGWALAKRPNGLLLRSPSLERAERWIASRPKGAPAPTDETQAFISLSRQAATRRIYWVGTAICLALFAFGSGGIWLSYQNHKASVIRVLRDSAEPASERITQFINEVESQLGWTTQLPWSTNTVAQHRFDVLRALRQMPANWEIAQLDASGKEQLRVNRIDANDVIGSNTDYSKDPKFTEAVAKKVYYGPVYFRRGIVPFITISVAGRRQDAGVTVAEVDLNGLWNEVKKIKADEVSVPYLSYWIDASGLLIAHSDNKLIESKSNMSQLPQVRRALAGASGDSSARIQEGTDIQGQAVFSAFAPVRKLNWFVFFEMLSKEVYAPARDSIMRSGLLLVFGIVVVLLTTVWLSRRKSPSQSDIHN